MKKNFSKKIIKVVMIFIFATFFLQAIFPITTIAANELNWENPNKNGNNPYKFKPADVLNNQLIMQVVGCTGVVDKVSGAILNFVKSKAVKEAESKKITDAVIEAAVKACQANKTGATTVAAGIPNMVWTDVVGEIDCKPLVRTKDNKSIDELIASRQAVETAKTREECFNGIAVTLAKNQLTSMTRYTMNWINTGFNGDPMYVQNITSLTNNIEKNVLEKSYKQLSSPNMAYPYGTDFSRSLIKSYQAGALKYGGGNFLDSMTSDLTYFINDKIYDYGNTIDKRTALQRAKDANDSFANDFSTGGWNGWLALTQRDQNNPLGFTMQTSQYIADRTAEQKEEVKDELSQNNGFRSQKKCVLWELRDQNNDPIYEEDFTNFNLGMGLDGSGLEDNFLKITKTSTSKPDAVEYPNSICIKDEVVTPGSIIKDKLSTYVNSPERQLELADTINDSLNSLFTALISKFQNQGLSSLSSEKYEYTINGSLNENMGVGVGSNSNLLGYESNSSGYSNGSFDLTRDLGNTYIHEYQERPLGTWNANTGMVDGRDKKLYIGVGPFSGEENIETGRGSVTIGNQNNVYYTVSVAGYTKLFNDGYNGWDKGDRAFWNGKEWQNWKKDIVKNGVTIKTNPIAKRGIIQVQKDYIVAAKELLFSLPNIMPKLGELDYCIPGPNPSWKSNSSDTEALFLEYANSLGSEYKMGSFLDRDETTFTVAKPGDPIYENYKAVFDGTKEGHFIGTFENGYIKGVWDEVKNNFSEFERLGKDTVKKDNQEEERQNAISYLIRKTNEDFKLFYQEANKMWKKLYFNPLTTEYFEKENSDVLIPNPSFMPMAEEGYNITKNIVSYDNEIKETTQEYKDSIVQANSNIYKLNIIQQKVSEIIKTAQDRRNKKLIEILNDETIKNCNYKYSDCMKSGLGLTAEEISRTAERGQLCSAKQQICKADTITEAEYKEKYKTCLDEEDILYIDNTNILNIGGAERCNDGFDNDLDGLIDSLDPDCQDNGGAGNNACSNGANNYPRCTTLNGECINGAKNPPTCDNFSIVVGKYCKIDLTDPARQTTLPNNIKCEQRQTEFDCTEEPYIRANRSVLCYWDGPSI